MRTILSLFVVLLFVVGCGGGGDGEIVSPEPPMQEEAMEPEIPEPEEGEPEEAEPEEVAPDCYSTDQETLIEFLSEVTSRNGFVARWSNGPVLQIARGTTTQEREIVRESVRRLNDILPDQYDIEIGSFDATPLVEEVIEGEIRVDFAPIEEWVGGCSGKEEDVLGCASTPTTGTELRSSHVWVVRLETIGDLRQCENGHVALVTHELLHSLGFMGGPNDDHPSPKWGPDTIMNDVGYLCDTPTARRLHLFAMHGMENQEEFTVSEVPGALDRDGLRALYSLENGDYPEELRIEPDQECISE